MPRFPEHDDDEVPERSGRRLMVPIIVVAVVVVFVLIHLAGVLGPGSH
jgi:hypothetical protein